MKHVIILSGHSQRFLEKGYCIKPLIKINDKFIIQYVIRTLNLKSFDDVIFIIKKEDIVNYNLDKHLLELFPGSTVCSIDAHYNGPVHSVLQIQNKIPDDQKILVTYCDLYIEWNIQEFYQYLQSSNPDGCIVTHTGWHPHRIYNKSFAYLRVTNDIVHEIKEKQHFTDKPDDEYASGGIYYFKTGEILKKYFKQLVDTNQRVNNEFYVTMPYNLMIKDGLKVTHFVSKNYVCLGTPKDVEIFDAYDKLNRHLKNDADIIKSKEYFQKNIFKETTL